MFASSTIRYSSGLTLSAWALPSKEGRHGEAWSERQQSADSTRDQSPKEQIAYSLALF